MGEFNVPRKSHSKSQIPAFESSKTPISTDIQLTTPQTFSSEYQRFLDPKNTPSYLGLQSSNSVLSQSPPRRSHIDAANQEDALSMLDHGSIQLTYFDKISLAPSTEDPSGSLEHSDLPIRIKAVLSKIDNRKMIESSQREKLHQTLKILPPLKEATQQQSKHSPAPSPTAVSDSKSNQKSPIEIAKPTSIFDA